MFGSSFVYTQRIPYTDLPFGNILSCPSNRLSGVQRLSFRYTDVKTFLLQLI